MWLCFLLYYKMTRYGKRVSVSGVDFEYKKSNKHVLDCDDILINRGFGRSG